MKKLLFTGIILVWNLITYSQNDNKQNVLADKKSDSIARAEILQEFTNSSGKNNTVPVAQLKTDIEYIDYYENGQINSKGKFKDGEKFGEWIQYWEDGKTRYKGSFENGIISGEWVEYDENGNVILNGNYSNGQVISYRSDEQRVREVQNYVNGKLNGDNIFYDTKSRIRDKFIYKNGVKVEETFYDKGTFIFKKTFDLEGRVLQVIGNGNVDTSETIDTSDSDLSTNGKFDSDVSTNKKVKNGQVIIKNKDGSVSKIFNYLNGSLNGNYKHYHKGKIVVSGNFKNGCQIGDWIFFYDNGQLKFKGKYSQNGTKVKYVELGEMQNMDNLDLDDEFFEFSIEREVESSYFEGDCIFNYPSGKVLYKGNFTNGKADYFLENGQLYMTENYKDGKLEGERVIYVLKSNELKKVKSYYSKDLILKMELYVENETNNDIFSSREYLKSDEMVGFEELFKNRNFELIIFKNNKIHLKGYSSEYGFTNEKTEEYKNGAILFYNFKGKTVEDGYLQYYPKKLIEHRVWERFNEQESCVDYCNKRVYSDSLETSYFENGSIEYIINKKNSLPDGEAILYYPDGKIKKKCSFKNGKINGEMIKYYENGKIESIMNYKNGVFDCRSDDE